jgi:hypothetical protein
MTDTTAEHTTDDDRVVVDMVERRAGENGPTPTEARTAELLGMVRRGGDVLSLPPVSWLVPGWLPAGSVGMIYGPPKVGKSTVAVHVALSLALGRSPFGGRRPRRPLRVLFVMAERGNLTTDRVRAWCRREGVDVPDTFSTMNVRRLFLGGPGGLDVQAFAGVLDEVRPDLVIIDTLSRTIRGVDENSAEAMTMVWENVDHLCSRLDGGAVLMVHHTGKDVAKGSRGSSVSNAEGDGSLAVDEVADTPAGKQLRVAVVNTNASRPGPPASFRIESVELGTVDYDGEPLVAGVAVHQAGEGDHPATAAEVHASTVRAWLYAEHRHALELGADTPSHTLATIAAAVGLADRTARDVMQHLRINNQAHSNGKAGRGARWFLTLDGARAAEAEVAAAELD